VRTDPNQLLGRPDQYFAKVIWSDERVSPGSVANAHLSVNNGSIELFDSTDDCELRQEYLYGFTTAYARPGLRIRAHASGRVKR
jgi:hypothetical protein